MSALRESPYVQINFLVDPGTGTADDVLNGFQEVGGI